MWLAQVLQDQGEVVQAGGDLVTELFRTADINPRAKLARRPPIPAEFLAGTPIYSNYRNCGARSILLVSASRAVSGGNGFPARSA